MGYHTDFEGELELTPIATKEQIAYIQAFSNSRRMKRSFEILIEILKGNYGFNGNYVFEGEYFIGNATCFFDKKDISILEINYPPAYQPSLWCEWTLTDDGKYLKWSGGEKFYEYKSWLRYLITHFFIPWKIELNGVIKWKGEEFYDTGTITVVNNKVSIIS